ncbi:universal stress protein [Streptomyces justiciae]|uniref:universal stress protein n=1 Tax=Streptomyces justiciae TaxID=2780140 RepID=UPI00187F505A|nr:universal stress protein [Streptomyces justiciae]MBE8471951.1 universal stress protein [Streptomyces justiciae]MCW8376173.1 universal stress protein [Streptomyces justiciae]
MTLQQVVVGTDGSLVAVRALDWASDEAVRRGAQLRIVYAVPDPDEAGPVLASAVERVHERHPDLAVTSRAVAGSPVRALAQESEGAALTVVGTRGFNGVAGLMAGSVSLRLAARVRGPLLVVRGDHPCDGKEEVLLGLEDDGDAEAAAYAFDEAERRDVRLRVLHSRTHRHITPELPSPIPATSPGQRRLDREDRAEEAVPRFSLGRLEEQHPGVGVESRTVRTGPAHALLAATGDSAVVVIGARRRTSRLGPQLGPVAHTLLHRSHCPVVLVPTTG